MEEETEAETGDEERGPELKSADANRVWDETGRLSSSSLRFLCLFLVFLFRREEETDVKKK